MIGKIQQPSTNTAPQQVATKAPKSVDEVLDTFGRVSTSERARAKALGKPGANCSIDNGSFNVSGSSVWNPLCWPIVTVCFGSFIGSRGSATTSSKY